MAVDVENRSISSALKPISRRKFISSAAVAAGIELFIIPNRTFGSQLLAFTDSLRRDIELDGPVASVIPLDMYAQTLMETLFPDGLVSLAKEVSDDAGDFNEAGLADITRLPETGTPNARFGKELDYAQIADVSPDLLLRTGTSHDETVAELNQIQVESGTPCVYMDVSFGSLQDAYRKLGRLFGCEQRAEKLARFIDDSQTKARDSIAKSELATRVFYGPRVAGKRVTKAVAVHIDMLSYLGLKPVISPYDFDKGTLDFSVLIEEEPDYVFLDDLEFLEKYSTCENEVYKLWNDVKAINAGRLAIAPALMHNILGSAIFAQSIGALWVAWAVAPHCCGYDMASELRSFYALFYGLNRSVSDMSRLLGLESNA